MEIDPYTRQPEPLLIVVSGPSGVGKDTVVKRMRERQVPFHFVVTATDRPPRPGEQDGVDYCFVSSAEFAAMIAAGELLEWAPVYGHHKGVPRQHVQQAFASGKDVVMRLDVQGAATIRQQAPDAVLIFLVAGSDRQMVCRLRGRKTDDEQAIARRITTARQEMNRIDEFDYCVVNPDGRLDEAVDQILSIIAAEHARVLQRQVRL